MTATHDPQSVSRYYDNWNLGTSILDALQAVGKDLDHLTPDDLSPIDQLHQGGKETTVELIQLAGFTPGSKVVDVGGGLGGPARTLAAALDCNVTVLDLSEGFCRAGEMLTERTGLTGKVTFQHGDGTNMPFPDGSFDAAWTQHSSMNIGDKEALYAEIHRVLKPGSRFAIHEIMAGPVQPIHYPVFWAKEPEISFLRTPAEIRSLILTTGFTERAWVDVTADAIAFSQRRLAAPPPAGPSLGLHVLLGADMGPAMRNVGRNLDEGRIVVFQGVFDRI